MTAKRKATLSVVIAMAVIVSLLVTPLVAGSEGEGQAKKYEVTIYRDNYGVPHVYADAGEALGYGVGYAIAQDRMYQADVFRHAAEGRLTEMFGPGSAPNYGTLQADFETRRDTYTTAEYTEQFGQLPADVQAYMKAYADGTNQYMADVKSGKSPMPFEFAALGSYGYQLEPWRVEDSMAINQMIIGRFGEAGGAEMRNAALLLYLTNKYGADKAWTMFNEQVWIDDPASPATVPEGAPTPGGKGARPALSFSADTAEKIAGQLEEEEQRLQDTIKRYGLPKWGSNAWVVSGSRTTTGSPMLYGGPQMGQSAPQIVVEVGLHGPQIDAEGMMFAGNGGMAVSIGRTRDIAWTTTSGIVDEVDTYVETIRPKNGAPDDYQYLFDGEWRDMEKRVEIFTWPGGGSTSKLIYRTLHGPVFAFDTSDPAAPKAFTKRRAFWKAENGTVLGFAAFNRAENVNDYAKAVSLVSTSHNMLYADKQGNIAYWIAGQIPVRKPGYDMRLPVPGTGEDEWQGYLSFEQKPHSINPDRGWLASWNNKQTNVNWPNGDSAGWGAVHRVQMIFDRLAADDQISFDDMKDIARDVGTRVPEAMYFKDYLAGAMQRSGDARVQAALGYLNAWDGRFVEESDGVYSPSGPGVLIFQTWLDQMMADTFQDELGPYYRIGGYSALLHTMEKAAGKTPSVALTTDYLNGVAMNDAILASLNKALDSLTATSGTADLSKWTTVRMWPFDRSGPGGSLPPQPFTNRGTYQQVVEFAKEPPFVRGFNAIPPGQSGYLAVPTGARSYHYTDQLYDQADPSKPGLYLKWQYKPMWFELSDVLAHLDAPPGGTVVNTAPVTRLTYTPGQ